MKIVARMIPRCLPGLPAGSFILWLLLGAHSGALGPAARAAEEKAAEDRAGDLVKKIDLLKAKARAASRLEDSQAILQEYLSLVEETILVLGSKEALQITSLAETAAKELKCPWAASRIEPYRSLLKSQRKEIDEAARAMANLRLDPENSTSIRTAGRFSCFVLGRWEEGLALLAKGMHEKLAGIARRDLEGPRDAKEEIALGDAWLEISESEKGQIREALRMRGIFWYQKARSQAAGPEKARLEKLLGEAPWRYLADMEEFDVKVGWGKFCNDGTLFTEGKVLVNDIWSRKSVFLHPPGDGSSRARYRLNRNYRALEGHAGLTDKGKKFRGTIVFQVLGDGKLLWKSGAIQKPSSQPLKVNLSGVDILELQVLCRGPDPFGLAAWLDPKVIR